MLKRAVFLAAILLGILGLTLPPVALAQDSAPTTSSLLVKLVAGLSTEQQADVIARNGGTEVKTIPALRLHVIEVPTDQLADTLARYQADPQVVRAEENKTRQAEAVPADPLYSSQWALPMISWDLAFGTITPTGTATVAILDTGIDASHPDLADKVLTGTSILDGTDGLTDPSGHGTWMAGIIAARTNTVPAEGVAGVGYAGVRVMPVTVLDANGLGQDSDVIAGVIWAVEHGANVILMAFSNPGFSEDLQDAIDYAWANGVVLVAAVGNDADSTPTFPAGDRGVIGVSATDNADSLASFSNDGQAVFLAAPGTGIETTNIDGTYGALSGTSASAAIVAGAAALMKAVDPTLTNGVIVGRLARSADPAGTQVETGNGRINLARALEDTGIDFVEPAGANPVGNGGPFVGPYVASALNLHSVSVGSQTGSLTFGTASSVTFTVTVRPTGSGALYVALSVSGLPTGATGSFSSNCLTFSSSTNQTPTLTITTTAATPAGATTFTVTGTERAVVDCTGKFGISESGTGTLTVNSETNQTINVTTSAPPTAAYNATFTVAATASSGLPVAITTSGVCSGSGTGSATITMISGTGTCTVHYNQAGNASYNAAPEVTSDTTAQKANQATLTVNAGSPLTYNTSETLTTSGGSGTGAVSYSVTTGSCTVLDDQLTAASGTGTCSVTATKAADANYNAATSAVVTVTLQQATQTIDFAALTNKYFGDADFPVSATGGASGQPVTFTAAGPCTVTGSTVHITGVGSCTITAHQAGDTNYSAAPDVPQSFTIIDNTPPDTSVDSGPTSPTNATTASFTFSGTDNVTPAVSLTFKCQLDSGGFSVCASPKTYNGLTDGPHTFDVRAIDAAGNIDLTAASFNWSVDLSPPDTILDGMPSSPTNQTTATFAFHATELSSTFECSLDGGAFTACTSPAEYLGLTDGSHTFDVRAIDAVGNPDATPAGFAWTVDTLAPDTLIDSYPLDPTNSNTATFTFHASEGSTFSCQLDAGSAAACNIGTVTYPGLGAGSHTFTVTATDAAGNTDTSAASFTWTIDVTPPDTSITSGPAEGSTTTDTSASFDFEGTDNLTAIEDLTFECSLDGADFESCTSPASYSDLSRTEHTFQVYATDAAGNTDSSPASVTWTITKMTPVITWANPADITYPTALSGTQLNATADVAGSFVYTPASGTVLNAGNTQNLKVDFTPTDATNYSTASKTVTINVLKATPVVTATGNTCTYNGSPCAGGGSATGVGEITLTPVTVAYKDALGNLLTSAPVNAGTYSVAARFAGDANYNQKQSAPATITITQAPSTVTVTCTAGAPHTYTGVAQTPCTAQATGVEMSPVDVTASLSYANNINVGAATASASWGGDANHAGSIGNGGFTISKANATVVVTPYNVLYDMLPHTATYTITGVNGETGVTVGTVTLNTTHTIAGTYASDSWSFTGTANYNDIGPTTITDIINRRSATVNYIGQTTWVTSGTSATTAQVTLTASMQDATGTALVGATADFIDTLTNKVLASGVQVSPVAGSPGTGTANKVVTLSTGQYGSEAYIIQVKLTGNYDNKDQDDGDKTATVVVSKLAAASQTIGGGTITNLAGSAGTYRGVTEEGLTTTFSVGLAYTKSETNPKGKISLIIEQSDGSTIYVKSNAITSVAVKTDTAGKKNTVVYTKSNVIRVDSSGIATSIDSAVTLRMDAHDDGEAAGDTIGFTVLSSTNSTLYYSNDWYLDPTNNTWKTRSQSTTGLQIK